MLVVISLIIGFAVVLFASLIKNVNWNPKNKFAIATVLSVLGGFVAVISTGGWAAFLSLNFFAAISMVFTASQVVYRFLFEGTTAEKKLAEAKVVGK